jgi:hypothetical protein
MKTIVKLTFSLIFLAFIKPEAGFSQTMLSILDNCWCETQVAPTYYNIIIYKAVLTTCEFDNCYYEFKVYPPPNPQNCETYYDISDEVDHCCDANHYFYLVVTQGGLPQPPPDPCETMSHCVTCLDGDVHVELNP